MRIEGYLGSGTDPPIQQPSRFYEIYFYLYLGRTLALKIWIRPLPRLPKVDDHKIGLEKPNRSKLNFPAEINVTLNDDSSVAHLF